MTYRMFNTVSDDRIPPKLASLLNDIACKEQARLFPGMTDEQVMLRQSPTSGSIPMGAAIDTGYRMRLTSEGVYTLD